MSEMQKGYEFVNGRAVQRPDYDYARICELAGEPDENGYRVVTIDVPDMQTAWNPGSTKHVLYGPLRIEYVLHPSGVHGTVLDWHAEVPE